MTGFSLFIRKNKKWSILTGLLLLCLIMLSISSSSVVLKPKRIGFSVVSALQSGISEIGGFFSDTINSVGELRRLKQEYDEIQKKLTQYRELERDYMQIAHENRLLREQLDYSSALTFKKIPAEIIAKDPVNKFSAIVINKGSKHGVEKDMPVIAYQDGFQGLVGKVVETGVITSIVMPLYDEACYVAARLQDTRYEGLIQGGGNPNSNVVMDYVKKRAKEEIQYGDLVTSSGMQSLYPRGIYIGRVRAMNAKEWDSSLELEIEPIIDFAKLEYVFILKE